jgi:hypothetical protein
VEALVDLVLAVARGELDAWSGCFIRSGIDTPPSLVEAAARLAVEGAVPAPARRLGIVPWGSTDPLP